MNSMTSKDYKYIIFILVLLMVGIFTFYYGKSGNDVVSYLGFAGTISSILISVVALLYTFYQSATSTSHTAKLNESSERLVHAVDQFEGIQNNLTSSIEHIAFLSQQVAAVDDKIDYLGNTLLTLPNEKTSFIFKFSKEDLIKVLRASSSSGLILLALCLYQSEKPKTASFQQLIDDFGKLITGLTYEYAYGYIVAFISFGILGISDTYVDVRVLFDNKEIFKEALCIAMNERTTDSEMSKFIIEGNIAIRIYYDNFDLNLLSPNN